MHASPQFALFLVRIGFGLFLLVWGLNKLVNPQATDRIFETFYGWTGLGTSLSYAFGLLQNRAGAGDHGGALQDPRLRDRRSRARLLDLFNITSSPAAAGH